MGRRQFSQVISVAANRGTHHWGDQPFPKTIVPNGAYMEWTFSPQETDFHEGMMFELTVPPNGAGGNFSVYVGQEGFVNAAYLEFTSTGLVGIEFRHGRLYAGTSCYPASEEARLASIRSIVFDSHKRLTIGFDNTTGADYPADPNGFFDLLCVRERVSTV